jgi:hypothetical protein
MSTLTPVESTGYPSIMNSRRRPRHFAHRRSPRLYRSRISRIVMLVVGVLSVPSVGVRAMQRPHCAQHTQSAHVVANHHQPSSAHTAAVQPGSQHECPHCPARDCAHLVPCNTSTSPVTAAATLLVTALSPDPVGVPPVRAYMHSRTHQPPTPPPQLIA